MRIIHRYVGSTFLSVFLAALLVLLFVMSLGAMFKLADLIGRGAPWRPLGTIFVLNIPQMFSFSAPMSLMVATLLVFGRLSADGEVTAMRSCGISLWQITSRPLIAAVLVGFGCLFIHNRVVPHSHASSRQILRQLKSTSAVSLLEEGRFIHDFPGMSLYIGRKHGLVLTDVRIYTAMKNNQIREIRAESGVVHESSGGGDPTLELNNVRVDPFLDDQPGAVYSRAWTVSLPGLSSSSTYRLKPVDLTWAELRSRTQRPEEFFPLLQPEDLPKETTRFIVEMHKRLVLSLACPLFVLLGIPLGVQTHRKESTIGIAMSTLLILTFHIFIIAAESLAKTSPALSVPILWAPVLLGGAGALWLMEHKR